jgi:hypothetical protein
MGFAMLLTQKQKENLSQLFSFLGKERDQLPFNMLNILKEIFTATEDGYEGLFEVKGCLSEERGALHVSLAHALVVSTRGALYLCAFIIQCIPKEHHLKFLNTLVDDSTPVQKLMGHFIHNNNGDLIGALCEHSELMTRYFDQLEFPDYVAAHDPNYVTPHTTPQKGASPVVRVLEGEFSEKRRCLFGFSGSDSMISLSPPSQEDAMQKQMKQKSITDFFRCDDMDRKRRVSKVESEAEMLDSLEM